MEKTVLIAGKDFPDGREISSSAVLHRNKVIIAANPAEKDIQPSDDCIAVLWNRGSALSARSLVISALNVNSTLDEAFLIFDEPYFASKYLNSSISDASRIFDELILSYQYLTSELSSRFNQKKIGIETSVKKIVFIHRSNISIAQEVLNQNQKYLTSSPSSPAVSAAAASFRAFAENTAASLVENEDILPVLIEVPFDSENLRKDSALVSWVCEYLDSLDNQKKSPSSRQKVSWIKGGSRVSGGFSLFK